MCGGLTGLVHGTDAAGTSSMRLARADEGRIEEIDAVGSRTATVQAGVKLQALQEAVEAHGLMFPLDLGARGSAPPSAATSPPTPEATGSCATG